ncbi:histidine kinase [Nonomuraea sp. N2-4H]|uniref:sensor histidine kinase n=1 Tax=Nonomuraea sp. N2-4H TaxID=3128898 RepID=UPI00324E4C42
MMDLRRIGEVWRRSDVTVRDLPLALLLVVLSLVPEFHGSGTSLGLLPNRPFDVFALVVIALEALPLIVRRRRPGLCVTLVVIGFSLDQVFGYHAVSSMALPLALINTGAHLERRRKLTAVLLTLAYLVLISWLEMLGSKETPSDLVVFYVALVVLWGVGSWVRSTRAAEAERRRRIAEATRTAERTRIARELHDVVTHHVTAMVVQAEAARYLTAAPERLDSALASVTETGRRAISDLRHLLDVLNPEHEADFTVPSASDIGDLIEQTRQAGQPVEFDEEGKPSESAGSAEFVTYRVVQEALTNALKYAHGSHTVVQVRYGEEEISVAVTTDGSGSRAAAVGGSGRGLTGLRERVEALGGEFTAEPQAGGGFAVRAVIPTGSGS